MHLLTALIFTSMSRINTDGRKFDEVATVIIKSVHVRNFRSIRDATLLWGQLCRKLVVFLNQSFITYVSFNAYT